MNSTQFETWVRSEISRLAPGSMIPDDRALSAGRDLSARTVRRVMSRLGREGVVSRIRGKGTFKSGAESTELPLQPLESGSSADRLAGQLAAAITRGDIRDGEALPQLKFLCVQYRISQQTAAAAYRILCGKGLAVKVGKRCWAGTLQSSAHAVSGGEVYLLTKDAEQWKTIYGSTGMGLAYSAFERQMRAYDMRIRYATVGDWDALARLWKRQGGSPAGVVLYEITGDELDVVIGRVRSLCSPVARNAPVPVLCDMTDNHGFPSVKGPFNAIARGNITTTQARSVARFCVRVPQRPIVFVFDESEIQRDPVHTFLRYFKTFHEIMSLVPGEVSIAVSRARTFSVDRFLTAKVMRDSKSYVEYLTKKYRLRDTLDQTLRRLIRVYESDNTLVGAHTGGAFLITPHDSLAAQLWDICDKRHVEVPQTIALLSLENNPSFFWRTISSCSADYERAGYLMAHAILQDIPVSRSRQGFIRVECPVQERFSTLRTPL